MVVGGSHPVMRRRAAARHGGRASDAELMQHAAASARVRVVPARVARAEGGATQNAAP